MTELLRHLTGTCMEPTHPSLFTLILALPAAFSYIKYRLKKLK